MGARDLDQSVVDESIQRAKTDDIKEQIRNSADKENIPPPSQEQIKHRLRTLREQIGDRQEARKRLERILKGDDLTDIIYLSRGVQCARSICRIIVRRDAEQASYGTGFLVAPGVLITNHHVLSSPEDVQSSSIEFNFERDRRGQYMTPTTFTLRTSPEPILSKELDMAIVAVEQRSQDGKPVEHFGWLLLNAQPGKAFIGEYLTIIQHPRGEPKQVCVRENKALKYSGTGPYIWYQTDTDAGSSGSPVFNNSWEVVALHHSSVPNTNEKGEWLTWDGKPTDRNTESQEIAWLANEGVRISKIVEHLQGLGDHPLAQKILTATEPPEEQSATSPGPHPGVGMGEIQVQTEGNGVTRILLPIEISVKVGGYEVAGPAKATKAPDATVTDTQKTAPSAEPSSSPSEDGLEKVIVEQGNYKQRSGYNPNFLGADLMVPLPTVPGPTRAIFGDVLSFEDDLKDKDGNSLGELKYWNYSVVMNGKRKLAYFSAANVDKERFLGERDVADTWYRDTRISHDNQVDDAFYGDPFDKGHLTSRSDLQWWDLDEHSEEWQKFSEEEKKKRMWASAKRNGDDSFHWTNCAPQHGAFNRANKKNGLWRRLELAAIGALSAKDVTKFCIINGPVFDAPKSIMKENKLRSLNLKGHRDPDGTYRNMQIPKLFFKVIAYGVKDPLQAGKRKLHAKAFVVSQENVVNSKLLPDFNEEFTEEEIHTYQVRISDLQTLTGLDFGPLCESDRFGNAEESFDGESDNPVEIDDENEIVF